MLDEIKSYVEWFQQRPWVGPTLFAVTLVMLVGSLWLAHRFLTTIPADYFKHEHKRLEPWQQSHPALRWSIIVAKNLLGALLILAGIVMIFTPGQGILSLLLGLTLVDVPGKRALERKIIQRPGMLKLINRLRHRAGQPPLEF